MSEPNTNDQDYVGLYRLTGSFVTAKQIISTRVRRLNRKDVKFCDSLKTYKSRTYHFSL